jgi:hypothetical protein
VDELHLELDNDTFTAYGLTDPRIVELRGWALGWEADIRSRLANGETGPVSVAGDEWDAYLDRL